MKDIKNYLHLYIGCQVSREHKDDRSEKFSEYGKLVGVSASEVEPGRTVAIIDVGLDHQHEWYVEETILNLRPLSRITVDEAKEINIEMAQIMLAQFPHVAGLKFMTADQFATLLTKGFDLFNLIPEGLAISKES